MVQTSRNSVVFSERKSTKKSRPGFCGRQAGFFQSDSRNGWFSWEDLDLYAIFICTHVDGFIVHSWLLLK